MTRFYSTEDFDHSVIRSKRIAVIGYGNQGASHAQNLRDSGLTVIVGARSGSQKAQLAAQNNFEVLTARQATSRADVLSICVSDSSMPTVYQEEIAPNLRAGQSLVFIHGFNIHYKTILPRPDVDILLVAPKGTGVGLRAEYVAGRGLASMVGVEQDQTGQGLAIALGYAEGIGSFRSVVFETTFAEETECDLFGEQAVLCGGIIELVKAGFETLVRAGYRPEAAYFECVQETKLIIDLLLEQGLASMRSAISDTAEWGGYMTGKEVIGDPSREAMSKALERIQNGAFANLWIEEYRTGRKKLLSYRHEEASHEIESVGRQLRARMQKLASDSDGLS